MLKFIFLADRPEAIETVAKWYYREWGYLREVSSVRKTKKILKKFLNRDRIPLIILAVERDEVVGAVQLKYYEMDIYPNKEHWIGGVYVSKNHRNRKIAEKLLKKAEEAARSFQIDTLYLQTQKLDGGLYKRLGWKPVETVIYRSIHVLVMKKQL